MPNKLVETTPLPFVIQLFSGSLFILFLSIILFAKQGCSPQTLCVTGLKMTIEEHNQLFCFFDVLGFSNMVKTIGLDILCEKYKELIKAADDQQDDGTFFIFRSGHPYFGYQKIEATYFSDYYTNTLDFVMLSGKSEWWEEQYIQVKLLKGK